VEKHFNVKVIYVLRPRILRCELANLPWFASHLSFQPEEKMFEGVIDPVQNKWTGSIGYGLSNTLLNNEDRAVRHTSQ
jgi:hypothetical protein